MDVACLTLVCRREVAVPCTSLVSLRWRHLVLMYWYVGSMAFQASAEAGMHDRTPIHSTLHAQVPLDENGWLVYMGGKPNPPGVSTSPLGSTIEFYPEE